MKAAGASFDWINLCFEKLIIGDDDVYQRSDLWLIRKLIAEKSDFLDGTMVYRKESSQFWPIVILSDIECVMYM